ncbi:MAG: CoB--CoM heterodisulfide reductase iron-sulfur subunit A family protein [Thermodesulfobacteriota bacterium]
MKPKKQKRVGAFVCRCGINIGSVVDTREVAAALGQRPDVAVAQEYVYMCSDPGQELIRQAVEKEGLDAVVVGCCTPNLHLKTFRKAAGTRGVNPFQVEVANIREQCAWVHQEDKAAATRKAIRIIGSLVDKAHGNRALTPAKVGIRKRALVIGAGIAGIQAALDIADAGYPVLLADRLPNIGGRMAQLSETFPTLDCSQCILTPRTVECGQHPNIELLTYAEVEAVSGFIGNFTVRIRKKATYVDWDKCVGCGICTQKCPSKVSSQFDRGLVDRRAISIPFPQAIPNRATLDAAHCRQLGRGKACGVCAKVCPAGAIDYAMQDRVIEEEVGAIVVATGYDLFAKAQVGEYGYGQIRDVVDGLEFERILSASGPFAGQVRRPSDGKEPQTVVFIKCVGSRDPEHGYPYCSKICCMYTAKQAMLYKHRVHHGRAYIFYIDVRTPGKDYEEFYQRTQAEGVTYVRGRVSRLYQEGERIVVQGVDTLVGRKVEVTADLVVLATAVTPSQGAKDLARKLNLATNEHGFFSEAHPKMRPVESITSGFFLAGTCVGPRDIPETVAHASGAASKVLALFSREALETDPVIATVDQEICSGCGLCVAACAYGARQLDPKRHKATVIVSLCQGCGACAMVCPNSATQHENFRTDQIMAMVDDLVLA